ncbi:MAG: hypothetical protein HC865_00460 [Cyanobacteria bacterium RU_5_0]|nr:hypothetical protein [Cyanobacteria bacterium RU_5_0]
MSCDAHDEYQNGNSEVKAQRVSFVGRDLKLKPGCILSNEEDLCAA